MHQFLMIAFFFYFSRWRDLTVRDADRKYIVLLFDLFWHNWTDMLTHINSRPDKMRPDAAAESEYALGRN